ncbi:MAG TPA: S9 family peptidase [Terriglobales bacterium]
MRTFAALTLATILATLAPAQTLPVPQAITDPKQIVSKSNLDVDQGQQNMSIERLYMTRQIGDSSWSPDGNKVVFVTNISGRNNLWTVPAEGGWPTQLTISDQRQSQPTWSPDGKWIAYMSDYDGDEQWDIFIVSPKDGRVVNLTHTREVSEEEPRWSHDGRYLAYLVKPKTSPDYEIDVYDMLMRTTKHVTSATSADQLNDNPIWSHDGKSIVYTQSQAKGTDSNIFIVGIAGGASTLLTPHSGEALYAANDISPDGKTLLITSNADGHQNVGLLDIATNKISWLTHDKWEITGGNFSPDGNSLTWSANIEGDTDIYIHDLASGKNTRLDFGPGVSEPAGIASAFTEDGKRLLYQHTGPTMPNDLWVYDLVTGKSQQLTNSLVAGVRSQDMVEPFLVHYPSRDGKWTISAWVYVTYNMVRNGQNAAIVYVHGGPTGQFDNSFNRFIQHMVNAGYMVIAPNYRGSTGYGEDFQQADLFDMGGGDLQDVLGAADFIKQTGYIDPKTIALMGGSYGGYLTMMGVTKAPDVWAAGVPIVPFVNWFTEIQNEDPALQQYDRATMGDLENNKERYHDRSPIFFVDQISAPLLLLAGANDPRCPDTESQQVVDAIKKRGGKAELKIYENEGHGFSRVENQIDAYKRASEFIRAHVPPAECKCSLND